MQSMAKCVETFGSTQRIVHEKLMEHASQLFTLQIRIEMNLLAMPFFYTEKKDQPYKL